MAMKQKKALMIQPSLQPPGGGQSVCAWTLQALKGGYDLSVLSWRPVDLAPVNHFFGTSLTAGDMTFYTVNPVLARFLDSLPTPAALLKTAILLRHSRRMRQRFDVLLTTNNEADFGRPGIQYIHYPWNNFPRPAVDMRWFHFAWALSCYYRLCAAIGAFSPDRIRQNITLANSDWTAARMRECYPGITTRTVYPPVVGDFSNSPWDGRENGFLCIGRIAPEKQIEKMIAIVGALREAGHDVHLHVVGTPDDDACSARITRLAREHASWIELEQNLSRPELVSRICAHRYGIHGMPDEHFGMSIAEMVAGGCIVFVPDGGGQTEIVGDAPELRYLGADDAVRKINGVLSSAAEQERLRACLLPRRKLFSVGHFIKQIREIVDDFARKQLSQKT
jgi:glycosyltransferase involved in cell wall biosynthesis